MSASFSAEALRAQLYRHWRAQGLWQADQHLLIACSGGLDSMVLVDILSHPPSDFPPFRLALAHVNYGLRGTESEQDAAFVAQKAQELGLPLHVYTVPAGWEQNLPGQVSLQMEARRLRYTWLENLATEQGYSHILLAHQADDQAETLLQNLVRGAGLKGLAGMALKRGIWLRPLLTVPREQIEAYAQAQGLVWREDSSNTSLKYRRNYLRHQVMPALKALNPALPDTMGDTAQRWRGLLAAGLHWVEQEIAQRRVPMFYGEKLILSPVPGQAAEALDFVIDQYLEANGFSADVRQQVQLGRAYSRQNADEIFPVFSNVVGQQLWLEDQALCLSAPRVWGAFLGPIASHQAFGSQGPLHWEQVSQPFSPEAGAHTIALPAEDWQQEGWHLRPWQEGDRLAPFGWQQGQKLISDIFQEGQTPRALRTRWPLLVDPQGQIIWVCGLRRGRGYDLSFKEKPWVCLHWKGI